MQSIIESIWNNRELLKEPTNQQAIRQIIEDLDKGKLRVAEPKADGTWQVNDWIKKAVILYFPIQQMETMELKPFEYHDKMKLKTNFAEAGVRTVPGSIARYGSYISKGVIMMPSFVNIGAYVDEGTMVSGCTPAEPYPPSRISTLFIDHRLTNHIPEICGSTLWSVPNASN